MDEIKVGQFVTRLLAGTIPMELRVTEITPERIICGDYEFCAKTGAEIDEFLNWGPPPKYHMTGSFIKIPGANVKYATASIEDEIERHL